MAVTISVQAFFPAGNIGAYPPQCGTGHSMILAAQAVPSAALVPCVAALPSGWQVGGADIASGHARFWLDSDQAGMQAVTITLSATCDISGARQIPSDQPGTRRFERPLSLRPQFAELRFYTFPGGCATYQFSFARGASPLLAVPVDGAVGFMPRARLVDHVQEHRGPGAVRAGCAMSRVSRRRPGRQEHALVASPGRDIAVTAVVLALTAAVFAAVADQGTLAHIQRLDDTWLRLMISSRSAPVTAVAMFLNVLGLVYITLPVRIALAGFLALRRDGGIWPRSWRPIATSEILIGVLKGVYDRARPSGSLVATSGASFPSGHSVAASVTVVAAVIALVPPGGSARLGRGRRGFLGRDGAIARLPWRPLAVRRRRRGSARDIVRAAGRAGGRPAPAPRGAGGGQPGRTAGPGYHRSPRTSDDWASDCRPDGPAPAVLPLPPPGRCDPPDLGGHRARLCAHRLGGGVPVAAGPAAAVVGGLGSGTASRVLTGLVQVACLAAAAVVVAATLRHRRFRLLGGLAIGIAAAAVAAAGIFYWVGGQHPEALAANLARDSWLTSAAFPGPADRGCGSGDRRRLALDEPGLAPGSLAHAARGGRGPYPHRHGPADGTGSGAGHRGDRGGRRAGGVRRSRPADGNR